MREYPWVKLEIAPDPIGVKSPRDGRSAIGGSDSSGAHGCQRGRNFQSTDFLEGRTVSDITRTSIEEKNDEGVGSVGRVPLNIGKNSRQARWRGFSTKKCRSTRCARRRFALNNTFS